MPTAATQVYRKFIGNDITASRFTIIGKHIYVATVNDVDSASNATTLVAVDFDGIYSGGAHIESLRADQLDVTRDANIGGSLNVRSDTNIGGNLKVDGAISFSGAIAVPGLVPVGVVLPFAGSTSAIPPGWLLCSGGLALISQYAELYSLIGTSYGALVGSRFRLPDLRTRIPVGYHPSTSPFTILGATGGAVDHTLTKAQIPKHKHVLNNGVDGAIFSNPGDHTHPYVNRTAAGGDETGNVTQNLSFNSVTTGGGGNHVHTGNVGDGTTDGVLGQAHNNMQPYVVMNYIIYTGVGG
jgi:microcystin-dependent protein